MALKKTNLEMLFDLMHNERHENVQKIIDDASADYNFLLLELDREERRKVSYIMSMIDYCRYGRWALAGKQLGPAEQEYYRYFFHNRLLRKEKKSSKTIQFNLQSGDRKGSSRTDPNTTRSRPVSETYAQRKDVTETWNTEITQKFPRRKRQETDLSDLRTIQKIAEKLEEIYNHEWTDALDELEHYKINQTNAITCLLKILLDAYSVCDIEADTQITKLEDAAGQILLDGAYHMSYGDKLKDQRSYLVRYRMGIANGCVDRMQETFRRRYLPEIIRTVGIYQNLPIKGAVYSYANQCVAICWAMSVQDPKVYLADDRNKQRLFDRELYDTYTRSGQSVHFFVWPPLFTSRNGKLVSKGVAQGQ